MNSTMLHYEFLKIFLACFMYSINIYWAYFLFQALYKTLGCGNKDRPWNQELYLQFSYHHCDPSQVAILTTLKKKKQKRKLKFSSVQSLCSTPGFPVHHQLLELAQTHVHWVEVILDTVFERCSQPAWIQLFWGKRADHYKELELCFSRSCDRVIII